MVYFPETPHAPDLKAFEVSIRAFLIKRYEEFIDEQYELSRLTAELLDIKMITTKKALRETHSRPTLEVVPLTGVDSIEQFVRRYEKLKQIDFRLVRPNDDIDAGELFDDFRQLSYSLNADRMKITAANAEVGLNLENVVETITEATATGNQDVTLKGIDHDGNKLSGDNHNFQVTAPIENIPVGKKKLVKVLYDALISFAESGTIRLPKLGPKQSKMRRLLKQLNSDGSA